MLFLAQTIDHKVVHDFVFALQQAQPYFDWRGDEPLKIHYNDGLVTDSLAYDNRYIPIGTVEFVSSFIRTFEPQAEAALRPLNVPDVLVNSKFGRCRNVRNIFTETDAEKKIKLGKPLFCKSLSTIKDPSNGTFFPKDPREVIGYQVSDIVDFLSEWRVFVFHNQVQYIANYAGDPLLFPDKDQILEMVDIMRGSAPVAYTLDVGVLDKDVTTVVECHRFFSCGLYGFNDPAVLPYMFSQAWYEIKNINNPFSCNHA